MSTYTHKLYTGTEVHNIVATRYFYICNINIYGFNVYNRIITFLLDFNDDGR